MTAQVFDLTDKLEQSEAHLGRSGFVMGVDAAEASEDRLTKAMKDRYVVLTDAVTALPIDRTRGIVFLSSLSVCAYVCACMHMYNWVEAFFSWLTIDFWS